MIGGKKYINKMELNQTYFFTGKDIYGKSFSAQATVIGIQENLYSKDPNEQIYVIITEEPKWEFFIKLKDVKWK